MPPAYIPLMIVDRGIPATRQNLPQTAAERNNIRSTIAMIEYACAQRPRLLIKDPRIAAGTQKVHLRPIRSFALPQPQQFHQPRLRPSHAECVHNVKNFWLVVSPEGHSDRFENGARRWQLN